MFEAKPRSDGHDSNSEIRDFYADFSKEVLRVPHFEIRQFNVFTTVIGGRLI